MARRTGIEPVTPSLEGWCSIRLSYRREHSAAMAVVPADSTVPEAPACRLQTTIGTVAPSIETMAPEM